MQSLLSQQPRVQLGHLPTPLEAMDRLSELLGGPRIWIKRDDATGLAAGGNKTRKLEFLLGQAQKKRADTVISFGAIQSNHARQTAAACAKTGLECHLILGRTVNWDNPQYETSGNILLDKLLGATIHYIEPEDGDDKHASLLESLTAEGKNVYTIPTGGSNKIGALGYVQCVEELIIQCESYKIQPGKVFFASASGGTQAGLIAGSVAHNLHWDVVGINVHEKDEQIFNDRIYKLASKAAAGDPLNASISTSHVIADHRHLGDGYGIPTPATIEAINLVAQTQAVILDPVYSGKGMSGLIHQIRNDELSGVDDVIFIHTGGIPSLFVYENAF